MMARRALAAGVVPAMALAALIGCGRTDPDGARPPDAGLRPPSVRQVSLVPGGSTPDRFAPNPFEGDTAAHQEGARLYGWFNCSGCHFEGGGGIGPALMDRAWIYGGAPAQIFDSIASGRANGMPAFGDKITAEQIWKITLHVQSLAVEDDAPSRSRGGVTDAR